MAVPSLNSSSSSSASGRSQAGFDNSGFNVNFGGAGGMVGGVPWLALAALVGGILWLSRRR